MKNGAVYIVVPLIALAVGAFIFLVGKPETEPVAAPGGADVVLAATTATRSETDGNYTIAMQYPQFGTATIDDQIEKTVDDAVTALKAMASASAMEGIPYSLESQFDSVYIGPDVVATRLVISEYTGGAHPLAIYIGLNFDRETGERLDLSDVLTMIGKSVAEVSEIATAQLRVVHGDALFAEGANSNPENFSSFVVSPNQVTFIFQPYQVAAYAAGPQEVSFAR